MGQFSVSSSPGDTVIARPVSTWPIN